MAGYRWWVMQAEIPGQATAEIYKRELCVDTVRHQGVCRLRPAALV